jgi:two-component system, chemotaxis family, protein-glutamate methylesterase/glutaminase
MTVAFASATSVTTAPGLTRPVRVLVVDDSAVAREALSAILRRDGFEVETAFGAQSAFGRIKQRRPDVVVLDLQMPGVDGLEFLESVMQSIPLPVVVCSSIAQPGAKAAIRALELGAVNVISKPTGGLRAMIDADKRDLSSVVAVAASARFAGAGPRVSPVARAVTVAPRLPSAWSGETIVIGASTGGTEALREILSQLPENSPPVVIAQHMPAAFTGAFARRLNSLSPMNVHEARDGEVLAPGIAVVAPGGRHIELEAAAGGPRVRIVDGPTVSGHRPSVDVLFRTAARVLGRRAIGVLLTGIGQDGARGLLQLKENGAHTITQSEQSCVVFGMPAAAVALGASREVADLSDIPAAIVAALRAGSRQD